MLNKPFCFISSKSKKDNNNIVSDETRKLNINKNILISQDQKMNNRYNNNNDINAINNKNLERVNYYKVNHIYNERVRSGLININFSTQNRRIGDVQLTKNHSAKNVVIYINLNLIY